MSKAHIEVKLDNAAFVPDPARELHRILIDLARKVASGELAMEDGEGIYLRDVNGNRVGSFDILEG